MRRELLTELLTLGPAQRLDLVEDLWDSLEARDVPPPTDDQMADLERRYTEYRANPDDVALWQAFRVELRSRLGCRGVS